MNEVTEKCLNKLESKLGQGDQVPCGHVYNTLELEDYI